MSKHPMFGSILQQLHDDHRFLWVFWLECCFLCDFFVETLAGGLSKAARGSAVWRRKRRMRSWWRHEQASVKMAMITAGHHSYRKAAGIEIGVQAGTALVHNFDMESDDTDPDYLNLLAPVTEYVIPAPAVPHVAQAPVIENMMSTSHQHLL